MMALAVELAGGSVAGSGSGISSGGGGGSVWVSGHMRNGKYVKGYSRRKG
jgi:hypothetical protein